MAIVSFDEFLKKAGGTQKDVQVHSASNPPPISAPQGQSSNLVSDTVKGLPKAAYDVLVSPVLKFAKSAAEAPKDIVSGLQGKQIQTTPTKGFAGEDINTYQSEFQNKTMPDVVSGKTSPLAATVGTVGEVLGGAGTVLGAEGAVRGLPGAIEGATNTAKNVVSGAKNAASGAVDSFGENIRNIPKQFGVGAKTPEQFVDDLLTPRRTPKDMTNAIKTGKVQEAQGLTGERNTTGAVRNLEEMRNEVLKVPGVSQSKTLLENSNLIHEHIGKLADELITQLDKEKTFFSPKEFGGLMKTTREGLSENPTIVGDAESAANKVVTKFERLVKENGYNPSGLLKARKALDKWIMGQKGGVFNPTTENGVTEAVRAIRQAGNNFLAEIAPNSNVRQLLRTQSTLYNAIDNIAPKAAREGSNAVQQFMRNHPTVTKGAKYAAGGGAVGTGLGFFLGQ